MLFMLFMYYYLCFGFLCSLIQAGKLLSKHKVIWTLSQSQTVPRIVWKLLAKCTPQWTKLSKGENLATLVSNQRVVNRGLLLWGWAISLPLIILEFPVSCTCIFFVLFCPNAPIHQHHKYLLSGGAIALPLVQRNSQP